MVIKIIQWNINGFRPQKENLKVIVKHYQPTVICLQETNFKNDFPSKLPNYSCFFSKQINYTLC